jgi:small subunit ribosomal protein S4e
MAILKRLAAPKFWKIPRKIAKFIISPRPGPHPKEECLPLGVVIRDYLKLSETLKETKRIIKSRYVKVNGIVRTDYKFPIGLMDVIEINSGDNRFHRTYRVVPSKNGFDLKIINDSDKRLVRIDNKHYVRGGKVQLNLHTGENILIDPNDQSKYSTGDVLVLDINTKNILKHFKLRDGVIALVTKGENRGKIGTITKIEKTRTMKGTLVGIKIDEREILLPKNYVFIVGEKQPEVEI